MGTENNNYPDFEYSAEELSAYTFSIGVFIISLKGGKMTNFSPADVDGFKKWLTKHKVRDISVDDGVSKHVCEEIPNKKTKRK